MKKNLDVLILVNSIARANEIKNFYFELNEEFNFYFVVPKRFQSQFNNFIKTENVFFIDCMRHEFLASPTLFKKVLNKCCKYLSIYQIYLSKTLLRNFDLT